MKNLIKNTIASIAILASVNSFAATESVSLTGNIAKAVAVSFNNATLDLGDMTSASVANFTVVANTDYTVSAPANGTLNNADSGTSLAFSTSVSKANSTLTITPDAVSATQAAGNYTANVTLTVAAI